VSRPSDAKAKMIRTAAALFRQRGYNGVGLTELLAASDAPKGSFYYHFPGGKEQLGEAAVRYAGAGVGGLIDAAFLAAVDFSSGVVALVSSIADWHEASEFREGCPITSIVLDMVPQSPTITAAVRDVFDDWNARVTAHANRLGHPAYATQDGQRLFMLIEGAWILSRAYQSRRPMDTAAAMYLEGLRMTGA
jgi:TetR/AcrR family transcriptional regulator, lmrAB and yxaGH operons repressor